MTRKQPDELSTVIGAIIFMSVFLSFIAYQIWAYFYFKSQKFKEVHDDISENTKKCNELNQHIEELKQSYADIKRIDYGSGEYSDTSRWHFRRPEMEKYSAANNVYNCSRTVCANARMQPFKYVCKYFNIKPTEENLSKFETILNDFSAAEQGKELLSKERTEIFESIKNRIPWPIVFFSKKRLIRKLGFDDVDFSQLYFPRYVFNYISSGGNSSMRFSVVMDIEGLDRFITYLSELVKFRKSVAGQRALMTSSLREEIKRRDHYTCKKCGNSTKKEPNLLLEIDHIKPLAKGGMTTEDNLQTLCWKCNRSKGSKYEEPETKDKKQNIPEFDW